MTSKEFLEYYAQKVDELSAITTLKNKSYGCSVATTYEKYGMVSMLTRIEDKINRINALRAGESPNDEAIAETINDLANYCTIFATLFDIYEN